MRAEALARRAASADADAHLALIANLSRNIDASPGTVVACVWPLPGEPDLRPLSATLHDRGCVVVLPETPRAGQVLTFRCWHPGCAMLRGRFGTRHPDGGAAIPSVVLVPLLAFDSAGYRLGYGGGYYDRTLAALPGCVSVGFGLAWQEVGEVPRERHDRQLDMIITEHGVRFGSQLSRRTEKRPPMS